MMMKDAGRGCRGVLLAVSLMFGCTSSAWAQDPIHKMGRGIVNALTGWIELPKHVHLGSREDNPVTGLFPDSFTGLR